MAELAGSFSVGNVAYLHDMRITHTNNVDMDLSGDNLVIENNILERSVQESAAELIEKTINKMMQPHLDAYNETQTRSSRKINVPYCDYWKNNNKLNKGQLVYEAVMQVGEHETNGGVFYRSTGENRENQKQAYKQMYQEGLTQFKKEFPHLKVLWAVVHMDEPNGTPHMHIAYCPIGENYKQGPKANVSIGNALACDGIERLETRATEEGFQMKRAYEKIHHEIVNPMITKYFKGATIKEEKHGLKHEPPRTWVSGKEVALTQNLADLNKQIQEKNEEYITKNLAVQEEQQNLLGIQGKIATETSKFDEIRQTKEELVQSIWNEIKALFKSLKTQEKRQDVLEGRAGKKNRLFGRANMLKEKANKELDNFIEQETVESIYLDEMPQLNRIEKSIDNYEKELDRIENILQEDLETEDNFEL